MIQFAPLLLVAGLSSLVPDVSSAAAGVAAGVLGLSPDASTTSAAIVYGSVSILKGPPTSTVAVRGPDTFLGSRHESEQVPPHPYWKL